MVLKRKPHPKFNVPNFGAKSRSRVPRRWRKQRGIDNKKRIKKDFMGAEPTIGYKTPDGIMHIRPNGKRIVIVHNANELKGMISAKRLEGYDVTIAKPVARRKRLEIMAVAKSGNIRVTNPGVAAETAKQPEAGKKQAEKGADK
ncbi:MAG: eL32 family ribosomal protein [Candidatus Micrarchaeaceae archaeon]